MVGLYRETTVYLLVSTIKVKSLFIKFFCTVLTECKIQRVSVLSSVRFPIRQTENSSTKNWRLYRRVKTSVNTGTRCARYLTFSILALPNSAVTIICSIPSYFVRTPGKNIFAYPSSDDYVQCLFKTLSKFIEHNINWK